MKKSNICKFPAATTADNLIISCFVLETNAETMQRAISLKNYRLILVINGEGFFHFDRLWIRPLVSPSPKASGVPAMIRRPVASVKSEAE